jgi:hypothetical protein
MCILQERQQYLSGYEATSYKYRRRRNVGFVMTLFRLHEGGDGTKLQVDSCERRLHSKGRATGGSLFADSYLRQNG